MGQAARSEHSNRSFFRPRGNGATDRLSKVKAPFDARLVRRIKRIHEDGHVRQNPVAHDPAIDKSPCMRNGIRSDLSGWQTRELSDIESITHRVLDDLSSKLGRRWIPRVLRGSAIEFRFRDSWRQC